MCETETDGESTSGPVSSDNVSQLYQNTNNTQEAILSVFDLTEAEVRAYVAVVEHPNSTVKHIADDVLDRHRHHISRSLRGLLDAGLVDRTQVNFDTGGVGYVYSPIPAEKAERYFQNRLMNWITEMCSEIARLDGRIELETELDESLCERTSRTEG